MINIPIKPIPKPRQTISDRWKKRKCVLNYRHFKDQLRPYKKNVTRITESGFIDVLFMIPMPKSYSKKKRLELELKPHKQRPDLDNYIKALLDALFDEDNFITKIKAEKIWSTCDDETGAIIINEVRTTKITDLPDYFMCTKIKKRCVQEEMDKAKFAGGGKIPCLLHNEREELITLRLIDLVALMNSLDIKGE